mgnify:CR=1 FL=1
MKFFVDLNSDIGEGYGAYKLGMDEEIMKCVTSVNCACGWHAGDPLVMDKTIKIAKENNVAVGAHPGYPDLLGFGRRKMIVTPEEARAYMLYQLGALDAFAKANGTKLQHMKLHGAFYNMAAVEKDLADALEAMLKHNNYSVDTVDNGQDALDYLMLDDYDGAILDVMMPKMDGVTVVKKLRENKKNTPVLLLTAKSEVEDKVYGLDSGADDYLTKPFSTKELLARINKILLRAQKNTVIKAGDISFDIDKMIVLKGENQINLTSLEIKLLALLFNNINKVVNRNTILDKVWEWTGNDVDDHTITVYFQRIRNKLGSNIITTVKGIGYRIDEQ